MAKYLRPYAHFAPALTIGVHPISLPFGSTWPIAGHELSVSRYLSARPRQRHSALQPLCNNGKDGDAAGSRKIVAVAC
jgi:hypothetical protein